MVKVSQDTGAAIHRNDRVKLILLLRKGNQEVH
jgi:hypothetical protein